MWTHPFYRVSPRMPVHKFADTVAERIKIDVRQKRVRAAHPRRSPHHQSSRLISGL